MSNRSEITALEIVPRVIIWKGNKRRTLAYQQVIKIRNQSDFPRHLNFHTDTPDEIDILIPRRLIYDYVTPDETIEISVALVPKNRNRLNIERNVFVQSEHPNITFQIPIIFLVEDLKPVIPTFIKFMSTPPSYKCFYEFIIYNTKDEKTYIKLRTYNEALRAPSKVVIEKNNFIKILLCLSVQEVSPLSDQMKIKVNNEAFIPIDYVHEPIAGSLYFADSHIEFGSLNYGLNLTKTLKICCESDNRLHFEIKFLTTMEELNIIENFNEPDPFTGVSFGDNIDSSSDINSDISNAKAEIEALQQKYVPVAHNHFTLQNYQGSFAPKTLNKLSITFAPNVNEKFDFDDFLEPPFVVKTYLLITITLGSSFSNTKSILMTGYIQGPDAELETDIINFGEIYIGEEHFSDIRFVNKEARIRTKIVYKGTEELTKCTALLKPSEGLTLNRLRCGFFCLTFFTQMIGKFAEILKFKVKNGRFISCLVRGVSNQVKVLTTPEKPDLGEIPFAVPQIIEIFVKNPLQTPIVLRCVPQQDGLETPLVLNVIDKNYLPIDVFDPIKKFFDENADREALLEEENLIQDILNAQNATSLESESAEIFEMQSEHSPEEIVPEEHVLEESELEEEEDVVSSVKKKPERIECTNWYCQKYYGIDEDRSYNDTSACKPASEPEKFDIILCGEGDAPKVIYYKSPEEDNELNENEAKTEVLEQIPPDPPYEDTEDANVVNITNTNSELETIKELPLTKNPSDLSMISHPEAEPIFSDEFEEVLDDIPLLAEHLVWASRWEVRKTRPFSEINIVKETLDALLSTQYFENIVEFQNYRYMDWNAIPSDPREVYCNKEPIHLQPAEGKYISLVMIPNIRGKRHTIIDIQICPGTRCEGRCTNCEYFYVDTSLMTFNYRINFNCSVPEIVWETDICIQNHVVYCDEPYKLQMKFTNVSNVDGFFFYLAIPDCPDGVMTLYNDDYKFYIQKNDAITVESTVRFKKVNNVVLWGSVKTVGEIADVPFRICATVLPARVRIIPKRVYCRQRVLCRTRQYIFIENLTPTSTCFRFHLKNEIYQFLDIYGFKFKPVAQFIYVTIESKFYDPGTYNNVFYLKLRNGKTMDVPIQFLIEGMPICFYQDITKGVDFGTLLINTKKNFLDEVALYTINVRAVNRGHRDYKLLITKLRIGPPKCSTEEIKGICNVEPKMMMLESGEEKNILISANAFAATQLCSEFRIQITDQSFKQRVSNISFTVKANFIEPQLDWQPKSINIEYYRTHKFYDREDIRGAELKNIANTDVHTVHLKVIGPFKMRAFYEDSLHRELTFEMKSLEIKNIIVVLNKVIIGEFACSYAGGRIICTANGKQQKPLYLNVSIYYPFLNINNPNLVLFTMREERDVNVTLENGGCMDARYKWKKLSEDLRFVAALEDPDEIARQILSEILWKLELADDYDSDAINEECGRNLTCIYQKMRCVPHHIEDPINIRQIIDEIIDNLDLEAKRYKMILDDNYLSAIDYGTAQMNVKKTLEEILDNLKLDDSYIVSEPSSSVCLKERTIYFHEKSGIVTTGSKDCLLHLPGVRKGFEMKAIFDLDVIGGSPQRFTVTIVHLEKTIELSKGGIYLGIKPWYEKFRSHVRVRNVTQYQITLKVEELPLPPSFQIKRISHGYVEITTKKEFSLAPFRATNIKFEGVMGFADHFFRNIKITVNDSEIKYLRLAGQGVIPIFTSVKTSLPRLHMDRNEIIKEYNILQKIYYFDEFKIFTEPDEEDLGGAEELSVVESRSFQWSISDISTGSDYDTETNLLHERNFFEILKSYVFVNPNDVPNEIILEQIIQTKKFMKNLIHNPDIALLTYNVYKEHIKFLQSFCKPVHLKYFTIQPLPFELHGYILNLGQLQLNTYHKFDLALRFFGPGKITAAARTIIKIPGLYVNFELENNKPETPYPDYEYVYHITEDKMPQCFNKRYRNQYEREIDMEIDPKLKHAHSFDVDLKAQHKRKFTAQDRKCIQNYYSVYSLNKAVCVERKNHLILCKILSNSKKNVSGLILHVKIIINPRSRFYENGQLLQDFLYIDLHLGPTLPILLRGVVVKK
ncbi:uncharacterized protein LOC119687388 isoform X2 [Teleopsis dalmanni]|nr:uncharacterized protein LOC119687388 isoform X2 [Teleopsis dalmanni]